MKVLQESKLISKNVIYLSAYFNTNLVKNLVDDTFSLLFIIRLVHYIIQRVRYWKKKPSSLIKHIILNRKVLWFGGRAFVCVNPVSRRCPKADVIEMNLVVIYEDLFLPLVLLFEINMLDEQSHFLNHAYNKRTLLNLSK